MPFCYVLPMRKALNMISARILNCLAHVRDAFLTNAVIYLISGKVTWLQFTSDPSENQEGEV